MALAEKAFADINLTNSSGIFTVGVTGGTINLQGKNISISGASQVANTSFMGLEKSGNITLNATDLIKVSGISFLQEGIFRTVPSGIFNVSNSQADAGAIIINTSRLILEEGVVISTASVGIFDFVTQTFMNTDADSGNIIINALESMQMNNAEVTTATSTNGKGGDLIISTPQLSILQNSQISASNNSNFGMLTTGDAGNLIFRVDNLILDGAETSIQAKSFPNTLGRSGIIDIQAETISLNNGARILVNSEGLGKSGILSLKADNLYLDNQAGILASTLQSDGGEISIQLGKDLILRNNSIISAKAGGFGDGGNLEILADLILAIPQENSDIVADAFQGMGGNINITAEQIFGLEVTRNLSSISEINASSQFGADGIITINNPDVDVSAGLNQLSSQTKQNTEVAQNCAYFFIDDKLSARGLSFQ
ncbi:MAG: S-layer family protein, partial [Cyanobacteria bacterium J083]